MPSKNTDQDIVDQLSEIRVGRVCDSCNRLISPDRTFVFALNPQFSDRWKGLKGLCEDCVVEFNPEGLSSNEAILRGRIVSETPRPIFEAIEVIHRGNPS